MKLFAVLLIVPFLMLEGCSSQFTKVLKSTDYEYKLKKADEYYVNKKFKYAEQLYQELKARQKKEDAAIK